MRPLHTGECYDMEVFVDRRRPKVEAQPYMRWRPVINGILYSLPVWAVIILATYFIAGWIRG